MAFSATCFAPRRTKGTPFPGRVLAPTNIILSRSFDWCPGLVRLSCSKPWLWSRKKIWNKKWDPTKSINALTSRRNSCAYDKGRFHPHPFSFDLFQKHIDNFYSSMNLPMQKASLLPGCKNRHTLRAFQSLHLRCSIVNLRDRPKHQVYVILHLWLLKWR